MTFFTLWYTKDGALVEGIEPWNNGVAHSTLSEQSSQPRVNIRGNQCIELQLPPTAPQEYLRNNWQYAWQESIQLQMQRCGQWKFRFKLELTLPHKIQCSGQWTSHYFNWLLRCHVRSLSSENSTANLNMGMNMAPPQRKAPACHVRIKPLTLLLLSQSANHCAGKKDTEYNYKLYVDQANSWHIHSLWGQFFSFP